MSKIYQIQTNSISFEVYSTKPDLNFKEVHQVHGNQILFADQINETEPADGIIGNISSDILAIKTADCLPLGIIGESRFALIHAGWRGIHQKIHLKDMIKDLSPHTLVIGPSIRHCCFEVQEDFYQNFEKSNYYIYKKNSIHFDLISLVKDGIANTHKNINIIDSNICTCCNMLFHSFRRNKTTYRNWNIIRHI